MKIIKVAPLRAGKIHLYNLSTRKTLCGNKPIKPQYRKTVYTDATKLIKHYAPHINSCARCEAKLRSMLEEKYEDDRIKCPWCYKIKEVLTFNHKYNCCKECVPRLEERERESAERSKKWDAQIEQNRKNYALEHDLTYEVEKKYKEYI
jgi:hypothetical protein